MDEKLFKTFEVYASYEKRFAEAHAKLPLRHPWEKKDREEIIKTLREVLGFKDELIPSIKLEPIRTIERDGYSIEMTKFESWKGFYGALSLYRHPDEEFRPLIFIFPGHGTEGRLTEEYQAMAQILLNQGANVCVCENIGQGERFVQGHREAYAPFECGMSFQGLIQLESVGIIRHFASLPWVDKEKIAACGNSGGGTITQFLTALSPELCAVASTGYPGDFEYILHKERRHCACNLLPHVLSKLDMWEIYAAFAPKPLLIEHGIDDTLIPIDRVKRCARKVDMSYEMSGAKDNFTYTATDCGHSWTGLDMTVIGDFFAKHLGLSAPDLSAGENTLSADEVYVTIPEGSLNVRELTEKLSGMKMPRDKQIWEICPPTFEGKPIELSELREFIWKDEVARALSQLEISL